MHVHIMCIHFIHQLYEFPQYCVRRVILSLVLSYLL